LFVLFVLLVLLFIDPKWNPELPSPLPSAFAVV